jgi:hypothetical protein
MNITTWHENHINYLRENYPWMDLPELAEGLSKIEPLLPCKYSSESMRVFASYFKIKRLSMRERKARMETYDNSLNITRVLKPAPGVIVHRCL